MHTRIAQRKWPFAVGKKRFSLFLSFTPDVSNFHSTYKFLRVLISSTWQHKTDKTGSCFAVFIIVVTGEKLMSREFEPFIFFLLNFLLYIGVKPINNAVIVSDGQQRDSAIHTHFKSFI